MNTGSRETYTKEIELDVTVYLEEDEIFATIKGEIELEYDEVHDIIGTQVEDKHEYYTEINDNKLGSAIATITKINKATRLSFSIMASIITKLTSVITDEDLTEPISINYEIDLIDFIRTEKL